MVINVPIFPEPGETKVIIGSGISKNMAVALFALESVAIIVLVQGGWVFTMNVAENVPRSDNIVVVMVRCVPKEMEIWVFVAKFWPWTVTMLPAWPEEGKTDIQLP